MGLFKRKDDSLGLDEDRLGLGGEEQHPDPSPDPFSAPPQDHSFDPNAPPPANFSNPDLNSVTGSPVPRQREQDPFAQPPLASSAPTAAGHVEKDLQLIIAKLDAVKSELDSLHQRVQRIERIAEADQAARDKRSQQAYPRW